MCQFQGTVLALLTSTVLKCSAWFERFLPTSTAAGCAEVYIACSLCTLTMHWPRVRCRFEHLVGELMIASAAKSGGDLNPAQMRKLQVPLYAVP